MLAVPTTQNIFVNPASNDFHVRTQYLCFFIYCFSSKDVGTSLEVFSALVCNKIWKKLKKMSGWVFQKTVWVTPRFWTFSKILKNYGFGWVFHESAWVTPRNSKIDHFTGFGWVFQKNTLSHTPIFWPHLTLNSNIFIGCRSKSDVISRLGALPHKLLITHDLYLWPSIVTSQSGKNKNLDEFSKKTPWLIPRKFADKG